MARETLGDLINRKDETESQVATRFFVPNQPTGLGVPFIPTTQLFADSVLSLYAQKLISENDMSPEEAIVESPGLATGILSEEGVHVYTNPERFAGNGGDDAIERFKETSSGFFKTQKGVATTFQKFAKNSRTENSEDVLSGHDLLSKEGQNPVKPSTPSQRKSYKDDPHYEIPDETRPIAQALYDTLVAENKFSPSKEDSPFLDYGQSGENAIHKGLYSLQKELGSFDKDAETYSIEQLRKIAGEMLFKAQSISTADAKTLMNNFTGKGGYGSTLDLMVLLPHLTQVGGGTVDVSNLKSRVRKGTEILGTGQDDIIAVQSFATTFGFGASDPHASDTLNTAASATSYGTMNSPAEPFDGVFPAGMALPVVYSIIVVGLFGQFILPSVIGALKDSDTAFVRDPSSPWTMALGRNHTVDDSFTGGLLELFGMPRTNGGSFFGSMMAGLMLFYGLKTPVSLFSTFGPDFVSTALNLIVSPGYYLVITKGILRDIATIINAFTNFQSDSGVFAGITGVFLAIETILKSYTYRFFMIMTQVGNQATKGLSKPGLDGHGGIAIDYDAQKDIKKLDVSLHRTALSRFHKSPGDVRSPLSLTLHHGAFLPNVTNSSLPGAVPINGDEKIEGKNPEIYIQADTVNRLTPEFVSAVEKQIDSEYVPFSIQDLRTNEIFSLPAFITSISDDFSIQHANSHGYGRTDPVMTYSKTTRSITLVYNLVAMNNDDHTYMYHILNKLVAMCYPQRDNGLIRKQGEGDAAQYFAQPFSQTPTASPVIRLRVGDLIKSNKSKLALEKLFGGADILQLKGDVKTEELQTKIEELSKQRADIRKKVDAARLKKQTDWALGEEVKGEITIPAGTTVYIKDKDENWYQFQTLIDYPTEVTGRSKKRGAPKTKNLRNLKRGTSQDVYVHIIKIPKDIEGGQALGGKALASAIHNAEGGGLASILAGSTGVDGYILPGGTKPVWYDQQLDATATEPGGAKSIEDIAEFLDTKKNPVARSFMEGSPGKGLACVITQLSLSYDGAIWGTGADGKSKSLIAPMKIQIQMGLSPIHDAPLGLNAQGQLFAPSHPVGIYSPETGPSTEMATAGASKFTQVKEKWESTKSNTKVNKEELKDPSVADSLI
jgi:hypothetical protein